MKTLLALTLSFTLATSTRADFASDFRAAIQAKDSARQVELVRENESGAVDFAVEVCEAIGEAPSEKLEKEYAAISSAWREVAGTRFVDHYYEYTSLLNPAVRRHRGSVLKRFEELTEEYDEAVAAKNRNRFPGMGGEFEGLAGSFDETGDIYHRAESWRYSGLCFDEPNRGDDADHHRAWEAYVEARRAREEIDLLDAVHEWLIERIDRLDAQGYGAPPTEEEQEAAAEARSAAATTISLSFEMVDEIDDVERTVYYADENFTTWNQAPLGVNGATNTFHTMEDSPEITRFGSSDVGIDLDGDGAEDIDIPLTGNIEPIQVTLEDGTPWAFLMAIGDERRIHQGIEVNLAPNDLNLTLFYANAGTMKGMLGEEEIRIFDDNMDGIYGSGAKAWQLTGLAPGNQEWQLDSIQIGGAKKTVPWSEFVQVGDQWYQFETTGKPDELIAHPAEPATGTLALDYKGLKPDYVIVRGTGKYENCFYDLTEGGKKGLEVPAGKYNLLTGRVSKGKRAQMMKALLTPGSAEPVTVREGGEATFELGAPFGFDFDFDVNGDMVTVNGMSVVVEGRGGEIYDRIWNAVPRPEVSLKKASSKKGGKGEKMRIIEVQLDIGVVPGGWSALWHPLNLELENKKYGPDVEVQLVEKKNKLFGKIESVWRGQE